VRYKNPETKKTENWCFEDLPRKEQLNILAGKEESWILSLALALAEKLNDIGDQLDLIAE
jgi:hypothetical protein